jgi:hypothetical protein
MRRGNDPVETRWVATDDVFDDPAALDDYPHRYLAVYPNVRLREARQSMAVLLAAVELLESRSWELVNVLARDSFHAVLRHRP